MAIEKSYLLSSFPNTMCNTLMFDKEIRIAVADAGNDLDTALNGLSTDEKGAPSRKVHCDFAGTLTGQEITALDALRTAHQGVFTKIVFHNNLLLLRSSFVITSDAPWEAVAGFVTKPSFFIPGISACSLRISADVKTTGATAQLQVTEDDRGAGSPPAIVNLTSTPVVLPSTASNWQTIEFDTDVAPRAFKSVYCLEGRLNGATAAEIRFCSVSVLETVTKNGEV